MDAGAIFRTLANELFVANGDGALPEAGYVLPIDQPSGTHRVVLTGQPLDVPDARTSPLVSRELVERFDAASIL